jgi:hypothetical protein
MALEANVATDDIERESLRENILRVPGASRIATLLADLTDADQELIERFLRDVAVYLEPSHDVRMRGPRVRRSAGTGC